MADADKPSATVALNEAGGKSLRRKWAAQRGMDFKRGLDHLLGMGKLRYENGLVWELDATKHVQ